MKELSLEDAEYLVQAIKEAKFITMEHKGRGVSIEGDLREFFNKAADLLLSDVRKKQ